MYRHFETARLNIRPLHLDDKNFILELVNTKAWLQFIGNRKINTLKTAEEYIQKIIDNKNFFYSVFELKNTNLPIGIITFFVYIPLYVYKHIKDSFSIFSLLHF